jgi:hypothetical protein
MTMQTAPESVGVRGLATWAGRSLRLVKSWILIFIFLVVAAALYFGRQPETEVLVRPAGKMLRDSMPAASLAPEYAQMAVLSALTYNDKLAPAEAIESNKKVKEDERQDVAAERPGLKTCLAAPYANLGLDGWHLVSAFPRKAIADAAALHGMQVRAWSKEGTLAVAFRGTDFSSPVDWVANSNWFWRYLPRHSDQYSDVAMNIGNDLARYAEERANAGQPIKELVTTGHSLGGGLAQYLAYSLPSHAALPRVKKVYAFNPSPVTGWFLVPESLRTSNVKSLAIDRVFEHGEVLAYIRWMLGFAVPPRESAPAVREVRFNNIPSINIVHSHSIDLMACYLQDLSLKGPANAQKIP